MPLLRYIPALPDWRESRHLQALGARAREWRDNPDLLRRTLRNSRPGQILVCGLMGLLVGALVIGLHHLIFVARHYVYGTGIDEHLSSADALPLRMVLLAPVLGGTLIGIGVLLHRALKLKEVVDPIEANAMHGGQMSFLASLRLVWSAFLSNVAGMAVGMEAAYTQLGSSLLSSIGRVLHLRREDARIFVAAGAAAAIAAAFNSPLAGAFYGFELILGIYTINAISQVAMGALFGTVAAHVFTGGEPMFALALEAVAIPNWYYLLFIIEGIGAAVIGIATMRAVTHYESFGRRIALPGWLRPILGGALFGLLAMAFPQVLGSGQGAITLHLNETWPLWALAALLLAKIAGSVISIGSGFRGGLFSTALFLGCLFGQIYGLLVGHFLPEGAEHLAIFTLVGMGGVAASIVGAPITIVLLILEMTGNLPATTSVLMGVLVASGLTRHYFGYSFSTWRFHLRGLRIQGAHDVGWVTEITIATLMTTELATVQAGDRAADLKPMADAHPAKYFYVVDAENRYLGRLDRAAIDAATADPERTAGAMAKDRDRHLFPQQHIRQALDQFTVWEVEELPVLGGTNGESLLGRLDEARALRAYAQELETRQLGGGRAS